MKSILLYIFTSTILILVIASLCGCTLSKGSEADLALTPAAAGAATAANAEPPAAPSETSEPAAAMVNGEPITSSEYEAELERYLVSLVPRPTIPKDEHKHTVIEELIGQTLLAQAALQNGYAQDDAQWQARLDDLIQKAGGEAAFQDWLLTNGYTIDTFTTAFKRADAAAWMRDKITGEVSTNVEQVHGRQILRLDGDEAKTILDRLKAGEKFADLAAEFDPAGGGDLDWFPKGYLLVPQLDEVFFGNTQVKALQAGEFSSVIQSPIGFHIVEVIERQPERPLTSDALQKLRSNAIASWMEEQRDQAQVTLNLP